jgi:hypothetical protein
MPYKMPCARWVVAAFYAVLVGLAIAPIASVTLSVTFWVGSLGYMGMCGAKCWWQGRRARLIS